MKKRIILGTLLVLASVAVVIAFSGCDLVAYLTTDIDGRVVNAKADGTEDEWWKYPSGSDTLEGATVQLFRENSSGTGFESTAYTTGTVGSSGTYSMLNVPTGRYKLSGTKSGWIFVPRVITISGADAVLPDLIAYPNPGGVANNSIIILLSWENLDHDLDAHLSYSTVSDGSTRDVLNVVTPSAYDGGLVFERDVTDETNSSFPRVETILVSDHDYPGSKNDTDINALSAPPANQLRYYAYCFNTADSGISLTGEDGVSASAWGQVDVMYGSTHYGSWTLPYNTSEDQLWVLNIDAIDDGFGNVDYFWIYSANNANYSTPPNFRSLDFSETGVAVPVDEIK